jgi:fucose permease
MLTVAWLFPKFVAAIFAVTGFVFLADPAPLSRLLTDWGYGRNFSRVFGICTLATAAFLSTPQLRLWGVALAGFVLLGTTVTLLERRRYLYAVPGILLLGTLPFSLANM